MTPEETMDRLETLCRGSGAALVGVADPSAWGTDPLVSGRIAECNRPASIMPECRSVLVIGIPVQWTVVQTAPSIWYRELYNVVNGLLDSTAQRVVLDLESMGHRAVFIPRDGYPGLEGIRRRPSTFFSHRHSAYLAGLGTFGTSGMLLTEKYGPRIRFTSVLTSAELPFGRPMEGRLCTGCGRCVSACPGSALSDGEYPFVVTDKEACVRRIDEIAGKGVSPCGRCIAECPVGEDICLPPSDAAMEDIRSIVK